MNYRVILSPGAKADIRAAAQWYVDIQPLLSLRFEAEIAVVLDRLAQNPYQFPVVYQSARKALLKRFQYTVYFTLVAGDVLVMAISHQRRLRPWDEI